MIVEILISTLRGYFRRYLSSFLLTIFNPPAFLLTLQGLEVFILHGHPWANAEAAGAEMEAGPVTSEAGDSDRGGWGWAGAAVREEVQAEDEPGVGGTNGNGPGLAAEVGSEVRK